MGEVTRDVLDPAVVADVADLLRRFERPRAYSTSVSAVDDLYPAVEAWLIGQLPERRQKTVAAITTRYSEPGTAQPLSSPGESAVARRAERQLRFALDSAQTNRVTIGGHRIQVTVAKPDGSDIDERKAEWYKRETKIIFVARSQAGHQAVADHLSELHRIRTLASNKPRFRIASRWGGWSIRDDIPPRPLDTIVLPKGQLDVRPVPRWPPADDPPRLRQHPAGPPRIESAAPHTTETLADLLQAHGVRLVDVHVPGSGSCGSASSVAILARASRTAVSRLPSSATCFSTRPRSVMMWLNRRSRVPCPIASSTRATA